MKITCLRCFWIAATLIAAWPMRPAEAGTPVEVRLQVAGSELRSGVAAVCEDDETFVPLELLPVLGLRFEAMRSGRISVTEPRSGRRTQLRTRTEREARLVPLAPVAELADAVVQRPGRLQKDGTIAPAKPGDWVYVLARLRSIVLADGALRVDTSFPVPVRSVASSEADGLQDTVECLGVVAPAGFQPAPLPADERRVRGIRVEQARPDVVRIRLELAGAPTPDCTAPEGEAGAPADPLLLDDLLRQVQATFPKLSAADAQRRTAAAKLREKQGAFDPVLSGGSEYLRFPDSDKPGALKSFTSSFAGVELLTPYGIKVITGGRLNEGAVKSPLSPTGSTGEYFVGLKLPLLGGAGINEKAAALRQSRLGVPLADTEFGRFRLDVLQSAANVYWDWVAAGRRREVARDLLALARTRADAVRERAEQGDLPLIDVTEANQEVQRRVEGLEKAERDWQKESLKLSLYLWEADGTPAPRLGAGGPGSRLPTVEPPAGELSDERIAAGRASALENRPELRALVLAQEATRIQLDLARNQRLPAVELSVAPGIDTGFGGAGGTLKAGIGVGLPLRQRTAEGRIEDARLKLEKLDLDLTLERQRILTEVDDAVSAVRQAYQRYRAAVEELALARRLEQGERDRFALGDSTLFLVNQRERATAEAAVKVIAIQTEYEQALAQFRAVTAQI